MSVQAITWAYQQQASAPLAKFLLVTIANYANERLEAWPSKSRLAADMSCSESSVCKYLLTLQEDGLVDVQPRWVDGVQIPSKIILLASPSHGGVVRHTEGGGPQDGPGVVRHADTEPSIEPSNKKRTAHVRDFFGVVDHGPEADVSFDGQTITLVNGERSHWLAKFDGDGERLELALAQAANFIQPNNRTKSLLVQVRAQLSRAVADKRDRDMRYAVAAQAKPTAQAKPFKVSRYGAR